MMNDGDYIAFINELGNRLTAIETENSLLRGIIASHMNVLGEVDPSYTAYVSSGSDGSTTVGINLNDANMLIANTTSTAMSTIKIDSGDTAWMLASCALVLFMCVPGRI